MLILLGLALVLMYQQGTAAPHTMSPTAVAIALLVALLVDASSIGPGRLPDKLAFLIAVPAIREGFDGSPIDRATTGAIHDWIQAGLDSEAMAGTYLSYADVNKVIGALIGFLWVYALVCLLPGRWFSKKLGRVVNLQFPASRQMRLNPTVWGVAIALGLGADLPAGAIGVVCRGSIDLLTGPIMTALVFFFGA